MTTKLVFTEYTQAGPAIIAEVHIPTNVDYPPALTTYKPVQLTDTFCDDLLHWLEHPETRILGKPAYYVIRELLNVGRDELALQVVEVTPPVTSQALILFNPLTGKLLDTAYTAAGFLVVHPHAAWGYNPWYGTPREANSIIHDPYGKHIPIPTILPQVTKDNVDDHLQQMIERLQQVHLLSRSSNADARNALEGGPEAVLKYLQSQTLPKVP